MNPYFKYVPPLAVPSVLIGVALTAAAEDWPAFRGPTGQGISIATALPITWNNKTNVVWKRELPGEGWSSPVVMDGRIFLTAAIPGSGDGDYSLEALCLSAADGVILWRQAIFFEDGGTAPGIHTKNSHASPTPLVADGRVYVHFGHLGTACLDLDGNILWKTQEIAYRPVHGNGGSPILVGDALIFTVDGGDNPRVVALDRHDGRLLWEHVRDVPAEKTFSFCTPLAIEVHGATQVIAPGSNVVSALDPSTGEEIWRVRYEGYSVVPRPVFGHGRIYISTGYDEPTLLAIRADGRGDVTDTHVDWVIKRSVPLTPSPLLNGDYLYLFSDRGIASCVDAHTGSTVWQERIGGNYSASPVLAEGRIYVQSEEGTGVVLAAGPTFAKLAENRLGERSLASYGVVDGKLFIRTETGIYCIQDGEKLSHSGTK